MHHTALTWHVLAVFTACGDPARPVVAFAALALSRWSASQVPSQLRRLTSRFWHVSRWAWMPGTQRTEHPSPANKFSVIEVHFCMKTTNKVLSTPRTDRGTPSLPWQQNRRRSDSCCAVYRSKVGDVSFVKDTFCTKGCDLSRVNTCTTSSARLPAAGSAVWVLRTSALRFRT